MSWYSLEAPRRGASNECPQHIVLLRNQYFSAEKLPYLEPYVVLFFRPEEDPDTIGTQSNGDIDDDTYTLLQNQKKENPSLTDFVYNIFSWKNKNPSYLTETLCTYEILIFCK